MKGMSKQLNIPQMQRILMDFEKESSSMDMKEEMMSDAVDDVMEDDEENEEEEGDKILREVLDEIGVSVGQQVRLLLCSSCCTFTYIALLLVSRSLEMRRLHWAPTQKQSQNRGNGSPSAKALLVAVFQAHQRRQQILVEGTTICKRGWTV